VAWPLIPRQIVFIHAATYSSCLISGVDPEILKGGRAKCNYFVARATNQKYDPEILKKGGWRHKSNIFHYQSKTEKTFSGGVTDPSGPFPKILPYTFTKYKYSV